MKAQSPPHPISLPPTTTDTFLEGRLRLHQPAPGHGYRVNVDSLLLALFAAERAADPDRVVDLGAGVGAVGITYALLTGPRTLHLIDVDPMACALAQRNASQLRDIQCTVLCKDIETPSASTSQLSFDVALTNPPFTPEGTGRLPRTAPLRRARHGQLAPFLSAAQKLLCDGARLFLCYPAGSFVSVVQYLERYEFQLRSVRFVHGRPQKQARLALLEAQRLGPNSKTNRQEALRILAPVIEHARSAVGTR